MIRITKLNIQVMFMHCVVTINIRVLGCVDSIFDNKHKISNIYNEVTVKIPNSLNRLLQEARLIPIITLRHFFLNFKNCFSVFRPPLPKI
jgi:hypothetical protein